MSTLLASTASTHVVAASKSSSGGGSLVFLVLIVLAVGFFFISSRRRQRGAAQLRDQVEVGSRVVTTAGLYATVAEVEGTEVLLEIAPDIYCRYLRQAIARVLPAESYEGVSTDALAGPDSDADIDPAPHGSWDAADDAAFGAASGTPAGDTMDHEGTDPAGHGTAGLDLPADPDDESGGGSRLRKRPPPQR